MIVIGIFSLRFHVVSTGISKTTHILLHYFQAPNIHWLQEIEHLLKIVIQRNKVCQSLYSKHQAFDSWRQVVEIILCACPEDLLQGEIRQTVLFEIINDLFMKVILTNRHLN